MSPVKITVNLPVKTSKKKRYYIAECPVLDVVAQGDTEEEALKALREALRAFLASCYDRGVLEEVLKGSGVVLEKKETGTALPQPRVRRSYHQMDVPIPLIMKHREREAWRV